MKTKYLLFISVLLTVVILPTGFCQDNTQVGLPEGAIARLGKGGINIMRFSPDGTRLAVGTDVGVWLYDVVSGKETALFTGHTGQVNALAFSPDGKLLASGGIKNRIVQVWELETGRKHTTLKLTDNIYSMAALAFSQDGKILVGVEDISGIKHWDVNTGRKLLNEFKGPHYEAIVFSQEGGTFASGNQVGKIFLWTDTGQQIAKLKGHSSFFKRDVRGDSLIRQIISDVFKTPPASISSLDLSTDGKLLASASLDKTVQVWNIKKRSKLATFKGHKAAVMAVAFSPDTKTLASGDVRKKIKLWDVSRRRERATLTGHTSGIRALVFSPNGDTLVSGSHDGTIRFWNPVTGKEITTFANGHKRSIKSIAFTENDTNLAIAAFNGTIDVWSLKNHRNLKTFADGQSNLTQAIALSSDAKLFVCQGYIGKLVSIPYRFENWENSSGHKPIQLWELNKGFELLSPTQKGVYGALAFSPDNKILSGSTSRGIRGWDVITGNELFHIDTKHRTAERLVFSPDGERLAAQSYVATMIWNLNARDPVLILDVLRNRGLAFSPDSGTIAIGGLHGVYLWQLDIAQATIDIEFPYKVGEYYSEFTFSPDGTAFVGAGRDFWDVQIKIWDIETGSELTTLTGHTQKITTLAFSHDGKTLASGSHDGTLLLWDWEKIISKATENEGK